MSRIIALDTETTGLDPDTEDVFEIATVELDSGHEAVWRIQPRPKVVAAMHPKAAEVNRYHERVGGDDWWWSRVEAALAALRLTLSGAHVLGAVPDFDTRHLTSLFRRFGQEPPRWHYHLIDIEGEAVGFLWGLAHAQAEAKGGSPRDHVHPVVLDLPWRSDDLSRACGVEPPTEDERHTALGDARWAARWHLALTGDYQPPECPACND